MNESELLGWGCIYAWLLYGLISGREGAAKPPSNLCMALLPHVLKRCFMSPICSL